MKWRVKYVDIQCRATRRPFFKHETVVEAESRWEAIEYVMGRFSPPQYGEYKASKVKE